MVNWNFKKMKVFKLTSTFKIYISQYVLNPTFTKDDILQLNKSAKVSRAFDGTTYLPGWLKTVYMK